MCMRAVLFFLVILNSPAYARFDKIDDLQYPWDQVAEDNKNSVIKFITDSSRCTGTVISDRGHVLTAAHCFQDCLKRENLYNVTNIPINGKQSKYWIAELAHDRPVYCSIRYKSLSNELDEFVYETVELQAISAGRVLLNYSDSDVDDLVDFEKATGKLNELRNENVGRISGDYLVFSTTRGPRACVKTADITPVEHTSLMSLSYPDVTLSRREGVNTNGRDLYASVGQKSMKGVLDSNSAYVKKITAQHGSNDINQIYNTSAIVWSDIDSRSGVSGAPVFNSVSELSAVVIYNTCPAYHAVREGCRYSTASLSVQSIKSSILQRYGEKLAQDVFSCSNNQRFLNIDEQNKGWVTKSSSLFEPHK